MRLLWGLMKQRAQPGTQHSGSAAVTTPHATSLCAARAGLEGTEPTLWPPSEATHTRFGLRACGPGKETACVLTCLGNRRASLPCAGRTRLTVASLAQPGVAPDPPQEQLLALVPLPAKTAQRVPEPPSGAQPLPPQ